MYETTGPGSILGRNLVAKSNFKDDPIDQKVAAWHSAGTVANRDGAALDGGFGNRLIAGASTGSNTPSFVWQELGVNDGDALSITLRYANLGGDGYIAVWPLDDEGKLLVPHTLKSKFGSAPYPGSWRYADAASFPGGPYTGPLTTGSGYRTGAFQVTVPHYPATTTTDPVYTEEFNVSDRRAVVLYNTTNGASLAFSLIRVDYQGSPVEGYFDGTEADTAEYRYERLGDGTAEVWDARVAPEPTDPEPTDPEPTDPEPEDDRYDRWLTALAERVAMYLGKSASHGYMQTAMGQLPVVAIFVEGYVNGHGFTEKEWGTVPNRQLEAVIVSAVSRLVVNPEQMQTFTAGDYTERPALLQGFTLAELSVLNRYRRRSA